MIEISDQLPFFLYFRVFVQENKEGIQQPIQTQAFRIGSENDTYDKKGEIR